MSVILFFVILVILIVSHEFGHFIVAKFFGIRVDEFAIGFPPRLWSKKKGETEYSINALPFGGYVKIFGENPDDESLRGPDHKRSLTAKPKWVQAAVISAGVMFNALLAWILLTVGFMFGFPTAIAGSGYEKYAKDTALTITSVLKDAPADISGFKPGDQILSLSSGRETLNTIDPESVQEFITGHGDQAVEVSYKRSGILGEINVVPKEGITPGKSAIGITMDVVGIVKLPAHKAVWEGGKNTYFLLSETIKGLWSLLKGALVGQGSLASITGPVGIVKMVGDAGALGFVYLLGFTALISINLAVINLIPIPALDGGRLFFIIIEAVKRSPINPKFANTVNAVGLVLLLVLMVVVTYHDIMRLVVG